MIIICEGTDQIKKNKLTIAMQKFQNFKIKSNEILDQLDARFTNIINELSFLGKKYSQREMSLKVFRVLTKKWDMMVVAMRKSKDLLRITTYELFSNLKAYEFEMDRREEKKPQLPNL